MVHNNSKTFYIITSLSRDASWDQLSRRKKFNTEAEAQRVAADLVKHRAANGDASLSFFILKAVSRVGHITPPIKVQKLK